MISDIWNYLRSLVLPESTGQRRMPRLDFVVMTVAVLGGIVIVALNVFQRWFWHRPIEGLNIDGDFNFRSWFHALMLTGAALCAAAIAFTFFDNRRRIAWLVAGVGLGFFALDESIHLHEKVGGAIKDALSLPNAGDRIAWEVAWAPIIAATAIALIFCVWDANPTTKLWIGLGLLLGASKLFTESLTFVLLHFDVTSYSADVTQRSGTLYDIIKMIEKCSQLLAFSAFFAGFAQYFVDRLWGLARAEEPETVPELARAGSVAATARAGRSTVEPVGAPPPSR